MIRRFSGSFLLLLVFVVLSGSLTGCSGSAASADSTHLAMASMEGMPAEVQSAPVSVQQAYQFAAANPETVQQFPCYCGCGSMGHTSNYSCYVKEASSAGSITYDPHALGCSICVDITQDVMRLLKEKKTLAEIRVYIDDVYSQYGPSNMAFAPGSPLASLAGSQ